MPKTVYFSADAKHEGIDITYTKSTRTLYIGGWYDEMVGIGEPTTLSLGDFLRLFDITEKDCIKALTDYLRHLIMRRVVLTKVGGLNNGMCLL